MQSAEPIGPDRPKPILHIGITGHRWNKLDPDQVARVRRQLAEAFAEIERACADRVGAASDLFASRETCIRLISGLAEGADQIAAECRRPGWQLGAILPFPAARYEADFAPENSGDGVDRRGGLRRLLAQCTFVLELDEFPDPAFAYSRAGDLMLRGCDLLIAVWDGAEQAGLGGTGGVVERASASGMPVLWVRSDRDAPVSLVAPAGASEPRASEATPEAIRALVGEILLPSRPDEPALRAFFEERWRAACGWVLFDWLRKFPRVWTWRWPLRMLGFAAFAAEWTRFEARVFEGASLPRSSEPLARRAALADNAATWSAHRYRSTYILTYGLSATAVAVALVDVFHPRPSWGAVLAVLEFGIVLGILLLIRIGSRAMWHQRWLDYRHLAELLRHLRFLIPIGDPDTSLRRSGGLTRSDWVGWYVRATAREFVPRMVALDAGFQQRLLAAVVACEIGPQIAYHHGNERSLERLDERLHRLGVACFFAVLLLLGLKLAVMLPVYGGAPWTGLTHAFHAIEPWTTYFDVLLPAVGAALAGIRYTGEFKTFAEQSADMVVALEASERACRDAAEAPDLTHTLRVLGSLASALSAETSRWRALYGRKHLVLPG